jgi:hypothetical protein
MRRAVALLTLLISAAGALQLGTPRALARPPRVRFPRMAEGEVEPPAPADGDDMPSPTPDADVPAAAAGPPIDRGPTMPVSSTGDKVKGLGGIFFFLVAAGWILNYSFSPSSPLLAPAEPKVNEALVKYTTRQ